MPVRGQYVICDCGEQFSVGKGGLLKHKDNPSNGILYDRWIKTDIRVRRTRSAINGDITQVFYNRNVKCGKCKGDLYIEQKTFEVTPEEDPRTNGNVRTYYGKQIVLNEEDEPLNVAITTNPEASPGPATPKRNVPPTNPMIELPPEEDDDGLVDLGGDSNATGSSLP